MKKIFAKVWHIVKNRYVAATLIFIAIFLFVSENNLFVIKRLGREVSQLNREAAILEKDIQQDSIEAMSLLDDAEALEAYGREHYYMKRPNEDIYVVKSE